jgi:pilus assembly protein Flp/PilA
MKANFERGQGLLEYALILILAVLAVIILLWILGPAIGKLYSEIFLAI